MCSDMAETDLPSEAGIRERGPEAGENNSHIFDREGGETAMQTSKPE